MSRQRSCALIVALRGMFMISPDSGSCFLNISESSPKDCPSCSSLMNLLTHFYAIAPPAYLPHAGGRLRELEQRRLPAS